jgi:hypothetical protein
MPKPDNYQDVDHRVHEFWERFPGGRIRTELHRCDDSQVLFVASIWKDGTAEHPDATGWAEEKFEGRMEKWAVETCETSSLGRALANLGLNPKGLRPSSLEMGKADRQAPPASTGTSDDFPITPFEAKRELLDACGGNPDRAREIWDKRNFGRAAGHGMNRTELDALLAKVDA